MQGEEKNAGKVVFEMFRLLAESLHRWMDLPGMPSLCPPVFQSAVLVSCFRTEADGQDQ